MRERLRTGVADALLCLIVVALVVELWITRSSGPRSTMELATFSGACAAALLVMLLARMAARHARAAGARADLVAAAATEAAFDAQVAARAESVRAAHVSVEDAVNEIIVEIVAAQQAIVREAYPDDILMRLRAAEDNAHVSLEILGRVGEVIAVEAVGAEVDDVAIQPESTPTGATVPAQSTGSDTAAAALSR